MRDATKKQELVKLCLGQPAAATAQELIVCVARLDTWKRNSKMMLEHLVSGGADVPEAKLHYHRKIVPLAYGHGPFYILGPAQEIGDRHDGIGSNRSPRAGQQSRHASLGSQDHGVGLRKSNALIASVRIRQLPNGRHGRAKDSKAT